MPLIAVVEWSPGESDPASRLVSTGSAQVPDRPPAPEDRLDAVEPVLAETSETVDSLVVALLDVLP